MTTAHSTVLIKGAHVVNEGEITERDVYLKNGLIHSIGKHINRSADLTVTGRGAEGRPLYLLPGLIDDQVHFREPGLTHKGTIKSESRAAVAGGITSYMEMPNTQPATTTRELLAQKQAIAARDSYANYAFYIGATPDNLSELLSVNATQVPGIKIFLGSSTGSLLIEDQAIVEQIFRESRLLIAVHAEYEPMIRANLLTFKEKYGEGMPAALHPQLRSEEACYLSSSFAVATAQKHDTRLHVLHISTARELSLFANDIPLREKRITAEACIHHLWFTDADYERLGMRIKWNPAIKTLADREALWQAVKDGRIDVIATDHAPHTVEEKDRPYFEAPSGGPLVQHSLLALLDEVNQGRISLPEVVAKTSHNVAEIFRIRQRGYIREGYAADLVLVDLNRPATVNHANTYYHSGWSPFEGHTFTGRITHTFINGHLTYHKGKFDENHRGKPLLFEAER